MKFKHLSNPAIFVLLISAAGLMLPAACKRNPKISSITLPPTSILQIQSSWAVINSSHLRLRQDPKTDSPIITTLWKGNVLEILMKSTSRETVEDEVDYWYKISFSGLTGWVFGSYLGFYSTREEAMQASAAAAAAAEAGEESTPSSSPEP
ncbi:MAG: SH3 domain-containing protein [Spirochaetales bacterium]|nr:MAG: SH3 domain-containing protein [Spirochaetales bacterium]